MSNFSDIDLNYILPRVLFLQRQRNEHDAEELSRQIASGNRTQEELCNGGYSDDLHHDTSAPTIKQQKSFQIVKEQENSD